MTKKFGTPGPRVLDPGMCGDARLARCSLEAQLLYDRLVVQADDQGRLHGVAHVVKAQCFPLAAEATVKKVKTWLAEIAKNELVICYTTADTEVIQVINWWDNQAGMRRAYPSRWPAPPGWAEKVYGVPEDMRPGSRIGGAPNADSAGKVPPSAANSPGNTAPAYADAFADAFADARAGSAPAEPSQPASSGSTPSTHKQFADFWCAEFERVKGVPYAFQGSKDGAIVKAILKHAGSDLELAKSRALALLTSNDSFYREKGIDLGILRSQWNRLGSAGHASSSTGAKPRGAAYQPFVPPDPEA